MNVLNDTKLYTLKLLDYEFYLKLKKKNTFLIIVNTEFRNISTSEREAGVRADEEHRGLCKLLLKV